MKEYVPLYPPWQEVLAHVPVARFQLGTALAAMATPPHVTVAEGPSMWLGDVALLGTLWHAAHGTAREIAPAVMCFVCAPMRFASVRKPQVPFGGAPVVLAVPP